MRLFPPDLYRIPEMRSLPARIRRRVWNRAHLSAFRHWQVWVALVPGFLLMMGIVIALKLALISRLGGPLQGVELWLMFIPYVLTTLIPFLTWTVLFFWVLHHFTAPHLYRRIAALREPLSE